MKLINVDIRQYKKFNRPLKLHECSFENLPKSSFLYENHMLKISH